MHILTIFFTLYFAESAVMYAIDSPMKSKSDVGLTRLPPAEEDKSSWSEVVVVRMHYDCKGQLMQQKVSTLRTRNDLEIEKPNDDIRDEYKLLPKDTWRPSPIEEKMIISYLRSMSKRMEESPNNLRDGNLGLKDSFYKEEVNVLQPQNGQTISPVEVAVSEDVSKPKVFWSNLGRFKQSKDPIGKSDHQTSAVQFATEPKVLVKPDTIIDTPIIACADGMDEGLTGDCRPIFDQIKI